MGSFSLTTSFLRSLHLPFFNLIQFAHVIFLGRFSCHCTSTNVVVNICPGFLRCCVCFPIQPNSFIMPPCHIRYPYFHAKSFTCHRWFQWPYRQVCAHGCQSLYPIRKPFKLCICFRCRTRDAAASYGPGWPSPASRCACWRRPWPNFSSASGWSPNIK